MNWKLVLAILSCNIVFMSSSYTMLIPFLPMYLTMELGVDAASVNIWSGIVFSATFVVSAVMAPIWGKLADKKGKKLMAIRSSLLLSVSYFLGGVVTSAFQLTLMRLFQGFAAGLWPMELAIMALYAPPKKLGICLGVMQGVMTAGGVIGPLLGGTLAEFFGMRMSFFLAAGALFINCLVFIFVIKEPPETDAPTTKKIPETTSNTSLLKIPLIRNMLIYAAFVQMVILILQPILTTYISQLAGSIDNIIFVAGLVFSLGGVASAISAPIWGRFGQSRGFSVTLFWALILGGIFTLVQAIPNNLYLFAASQFAVGLFFAGIHPSINAILAQNTDSHTKGRIFGLMFSAQQLGSMAGPILGGLIATFIGMKPVFIVAGLILITISYLSRRQQHDFK